MLIVSPRPNRRVVLYEEVHWQPRLPKPDPIVFTSETEYGVTTMNPEVKVRVTPDAGEADESAAALSAWEEPDTGRWGVFDAQMLMAYPDTTAPVSVRSTKEEAETEADSLTPGNGRRGKRLHVAKMIPLDYSVRERDSELAVRAEVIAKAWLKMQEKDPLGHLHEQVACEKVNLQLAELAKTALRTLIGEMERGTETTIFVKPPMPCDNIKVEFEPHRGEAQSAGPMDDKGTGLVIVTYRPQDFPQGASEDSSSGDGPDYKGEGDSSCSMSPAPPKLGFWRWLTDWALGRKQEDAAGSGKIIPSCGPPPPFRLKSDPVIPSCVSRRNIRCGPGSLPRPRYWPEARPRPGI